MPSPFNRYMSVRRGASIAGTGRQQPPFDAGLRGHYAEPAISKSRRETVPCLGRFAATGGSGPLVAPGRTRPRDVRPRGGTSMQRRPYPARCDRKRERRCAELRGYWSGLSCCRRSRPPVPPAPTGNGVGNGGTPGNGGQSDEGSVGNGRSGGNNHRVAMDGRAKGRIKFATLAPARRSSVAAIPPRFRRARPPRSRR
jgi:hypothetical protein